MSFTTTIVTGLIVNLRMLWVRILSITTVVTKVLLDSSKKPLILHGATQWKEVVPVHPPSSCIVCSPSQHSTSLCNCEKTHKSHYYCSGLSIQIGIYYKLPLLYYLTSQNILLYLSGWYSRSTVVWHFPHLSPLSHLSQLLPHNYSILKCFTLCL